MKKANILMSILLLFCFCALVVVIVINENVVFELNGEDNIVVEVNSNYIDNGYIARVFNKDLSKNVQVKNKVDTSKIGTYNINYYLSYMGKIDMLTRTVEVIDSNKE